MFNSALIKVIEQFKTLPGVGEKSAQRLAFFIVKQGQQAQKQFGETLNTLYENIHYCKNCQNFSDTDFCEICTNDKREKNIICIIETPFDVLAIENTHSFSGQYHVLHGVLSPIDGVRPQDLKIEELLVRLQENKIEELIFALAPTLEGEATMNYIKNKLGDNIIITQLARGLSSGTSLEYADEITLTRALRERR